MMPKRWLTMAPEEAADDDAEETADDDAEDTDEAEGDDSAEALEKRPMTWRPRLPALRPKQTMLLPVSLIKWNPPWPNK